MSNVPSNNAAQISAAEKRWQQAWPQALSSWSKYTRLSDPIWCRTAAAAKLEGLTASFAMIRLVDQRVVIDLAQLCQGGLDAYAVQVLAHEIGHHIYAPGNLSDHVRAIARIRRALIDQGHRAAMIANLYTDLLINDRLQRSAELDMAAVFSHLVRNDPEQTSLLWRVYLRVYELLWQLPSRSLCLQPLPDNAEGDARLGARLVRHYAGDWLRGAAPFAMLMYPHLIADQADSNSSICQGKQNAAALDKLMDTEGAGLDGEPYGLTEMDADEYAGVHPSLDPALNGAAIDCDAIPDAAADARAKAAQAQAQQSHGQARDPFEYGELLRAAGIKISPKLATIQYYRERALPHLIAFPTRPAPLSQELIPEGTSPWEVGEPFDEIDWLQSLLICPVPIPGVTTVRREYGLSPGSEPARVPIDLDIYVDSSGSMPDPARSFSYPALAGAVIALSALRTRARVQVTLWSGKNQLMSTPGFVREEDPILAVLTGCIGGGTQFPLPKLRDSYSARSKFDRPAHILVVSDDGASTMFDSPDERGVSGFEVCRTALEKARGGGTLVLQLDPQWEARTVKVGHPFHCFKQARTDGWDIFAVNTLQDLMQFAIAFVQQNYGARADAPVASRVENV